MPRRIIIGAAGLAFLAAINASVVPAASAQKRGLVGALLGAGATAAGAAARSGSEGPKTYGSDHLRPEALKGCLITAHRLDNGDDEMSARSKKVKDDKAAIEKESAALDRDGKKEFTQQEDVDRYNARVRAYKTKAAAFNKSVDAYEDFRKKRNTDIDSFNKGCAGKQYYVSDLASIQGQLPFDPAKYSAKK